MGNLRQKYTDEEWDELVEKSKNFKVSVQPTKNKVTRFEVIDFSNSKDPVGRAYVKRNFKNIELSYQDDGKTLKIFIT